MEKKPLENQIAFQKRQPRIEAVELDSKGRMVGLAIGNEKRISKIRHNKGKSAVASLKNKRV